MQEVTEIGKKRKRGVVEPLYVSYYDEIYQYAFSLLENVHDAEDAVHTVFLHVVNRWRDLSSAPKQEVRNFLYKAVRNASLDIMRRRACYREIPLDSLEAQERLACYMTRGGQESVLSGDTNGLFGSAGEACLLYDTRSAGNI